MKKILFFVFMAVFAVYGVQMAQFDDISKNITVKNDYWSCSFVEGSMFPGNFVFADGSRAGAVLFRDTVTYQGKEFALFEERHSEKKIIRNTEDEFIVEFSGTYWRNVSPLITAVKGLNVICRYEFKRNLPSVKMIFKYAFNDAQKIVFNNFLTVGWYYENPFDKAIFDGKSYKLSKNLHLDGAKTAAFANSEFSVQLEGKNICADIPTRKNIISCMLGESDKRTVENSGTFEKQAFLRLQKK